MSDEARTTARMMATLPQVGRLEQILIRPERRAAPVAVDRVQVHADGLEGDHARGKATRSKRQVTLIQAEHVPVIGALSGHPGLSAATLRRNLVIAGLPVTALKDKRVRIGPDVVLEWTDVCDPCSRIEAALGPGGFNAMRGMGGVCCRIVQGGAISTGDLVVAEPVGPAATAET